MSKIDNWTQSPEGMRRIKDEPYSVSYSLEWAEGNATNLTSRAKVRKILSDIRRAIPRGSNTLDIGCGGGSLVDALVRLGYDATGYDSSPICLKYAESHGSGKYTNELPRGSQFDFVSAVHVLEHVDNPKDILSKIHSLIRKEGIFYAIVPNLNTIHGILGEQYQFLVFDANHRIAWGIQGLKHYLEEVGFSIINVKQRAYFGIFASAVASKLYRSVFGIQRQKKSQNEYGNIKESFLSKFFRLIDYIIPPKTVIDEKEHHLFDEIVITARK